MKCPGCGAEQNPESRFCNKCGSPIAGVKAAAEEERSSKTPPKTANAPVSFPPDNKKSTKQRPLLKFILFLIPLAIIAAAIKIFILPLFGGGNYIAAKDMILTFPEDGQTAVYVNNGPKILIDGDPYSISSSLTGDRAVIVTQESGFIIWYADRTGVKKIAETDVPIAVISAEGNKVAYYSEYDSGMEIAALYTYNAPSGQSERIADEAAAMPGREGMLALSPDGSIITYVMDYDQNTESFTCYIKNGSLAAIKLEDNVLPFAVSNGGRYMYLAKKSGDDGVGIYVRKGNTENRLLSDIDELYCLCFNRDLSEVIVSAYTGIYLSKNGAGRTRVSDEDMFYFVLPQQYIASNKGSSQTSSINMILGVNTFDNLLINTESELLRIDEDFGADTINPLEDGIYTPSLSPDAGVLYFVDYAQNLYSLDLKTPDAETVQIAEEVYSVYPAAGGVYYVDNDQTLWYSKNGKANPVAENVYSYDLDNTVMGYSALSENGGTLYFMTDYSREQGGQLCYSVGGGKARRIDGMYDIQTIASTPKGVLAQNANGDYFRLTRRGVFERLDLTGGSIYWQDKFYGFNGHLWQ